jgi:hypothetical protein
MRTCWIDGSKAKSAARQKSGILYSNMQVVLFAGEIRIAAARAGRCREKAYPSISCCAANAKVVAILGAATKKPTGIAGGLWR